MKSKGTILATLILALLTLTTYSGATAQLNKRQPFRGLTPPIPTTPSRSSQIGSGRTPEAISLRSLGPKQGNRSNRAHVDSTAFLKSVKVDPYSVNNSNDPAGFFYDPDGTAWGMVTIYSYPYQVFAGVFGNNDQGQICGYTFDPGAHRYMGFIGELPLQRNSH